MALREIRKFEDDILRKKSRYVEKIDQKVLDLLNDMAETMYNTGNGAGLAAPQVGILKRLVVIDMGDGLLKLINPEIIKQEGTQEVVEGCLSIPGKWGKVKRPYKVDVKAINTEGEEFVMTGGGEMAKALCHEIDHLDGVLFVDKVIEYIK